MTQLVRYRRCWHAAAVSNVTAEYGPFHRLESSRQTMEDATRIVLSGELWGRAPRGSAVPQVQAWTGPLPARHRGIEFMTPIPPTPGTPPHEARWRPNTSGVTLTADGDHAKIPVRVTRNTQV